MSDFNLDNLAAYLNSTAEGPEVSARSAPFGQVTNTLLKLRDDQGMQDRVDSIIVWTQPENIIGSFSELVSYRPVDIERIFAEVDGFSEQIDEVSRCVNSVFVPTWVRPPHDRGLGMSDFAAGNGLARTLLEMNLRLARNLDNCSNVFLLDSQRWLQECGPRATNPTTWYLSKSPFSPKLFKAASSDLKSALRGIGGAARKLVIVDLDDTIWGGLVGESGWEHLELGGPDPRGEAFTDFQGSLRNLTRRGILLGVVSKNDERTALEVFSKHPEMVLCAGDISGFRINWKDKADNIVELSQELGFGLESVVFIDNSPIERDRVSQALPDVLVPEWPKNPLLYQRSLLSLRCFDSPALSDEDRNRGASYRVQRSRERLKRSSGSYVDWLRSLSTVVALEPLSKKNLQRAAQLFNKTNQMNLRTRRLPESELATWASAKNRELLTIRVKDRFGDSGLTGVVSLELLENRAEIVDFLLSCRVLGRKIETALLSIALNRSAGMGASEVVASWSPNNRNGLCREFFRSTEMERVGGEEGPGETFRWKTLMAYPFPSEITLESNS